MRTIVVAADHVNCDTGIHWLVVHCHCRATRGVVTMTRRSTRANRIVNGALRNGGLYIKLGQGLGSFNHVLPREYIDSLAVLQDLVSVGEWGSLSAHRLQEWVSLCIGLYEIEWASVCMGLSEQLASVYQVH